MSTATRPDPTHHDGGSDVAYDALVIDVWANGHHHIVDNPSRTEGTPRMARHAARIRRSAKRVGVRVHVSTLAGGSLLVNRGH